MFKKISVFLVLVLVIGALSACAGSIPKLSEEKKAEIEDAWYSRYKWTWHDEGGLCRYYGTYEGYDIIFNQMGALQPDVLGTQKIAGIEFFSGNPFNFYGYRNGKLYEVHELYEQGKLGADSIAAAAEIHNSEKKTLPLSDERKEEISRAWFNENQSLIWNSRNDQVRSAVYYGNFEGYDIVFQIFGIGGPGKNGDTYPGFTVGDYRFACKNFYANIYGYKYGTYIPLHTLYDEGLMDDDTVAQILEIHERSREAFE